MHAAASALLAAAAAAGGLVIAGHHPLWPVAATAAFLAWCAVAARHPHIWLAVVPAVLPLASLAPWTGWIAVDEFDLVVLGAMAGGHARLALQRDATPAWPRLALPWVLLAVVAFPHGWWTAAGPTGWFDGETERLNAWRIFKGPLYAVLAAPMLMRAFNHGAQAAMARLTAGMLVGVAGVVLATAWERVAFPGLFGFADDYRIVAAFWEMHVGGAAVDAYLALAVPFVAHAAARADTAGRWILAAALAVAVEYTVLVTHARGAYLAAAGGLLTYVLLQRRMAPTRPPAAPRWGTARRGLVVVLVLEAAALLSADAFMLMRARRTPLDVGTRLAHWGHGLALLHGPAQWAFGIGLGRLPAAYAATVHEHDLSGAVHAVHREDGSWATLEGPPRTPAWAGLYALTQRLPPGTGMPVHLALQVRADRPTRLRVSVCELHLLYPGRCADGLVLAGTAPGWQRRALRLGDADGPWRSPVLGLSVLDVGGRVDVDDVVLQDDGRNLVRNGDFSQGLARWFPSAQRYFVPWHIDSLPLEVLIEQGLAGLVALGMLVAGALHAALSPRNRGLPGAPVLVASVLAALLVGLVSSMLDVPRVAFLLFLLLLVAVQSGQAQSARDGIR